MKEGTAFALFMTIVCIGSLILFAFDPLHMWTSKHQPVMDSIEHGKTYQLRNLETGITVRKVHITNKNGDIIASYYETPIIEDSLLLDHSKIP